MLDNTEVTMVRCPKTKEIYRVSDDGMCEDRLFLISTRDVLSIDKGSLYKYDIISTEKIPAKRKNWCLFGGV